MTDRRVGSEGLNVDIKADPQRRVGAEGLTVDVAPVEGKERQLDTLGITADVTVPLGVQYGQAGLSVDLVPVHSALRTGGLGLMIDYVAALITAGIGWSGTQFVATGGTPVLWGADAFQVAGAYPPVQWDDGAFTT